MAIQFLNTGYFPDNAKLTFGDATTPDLEIYHDGTDSYIAEVGTGDLIISGGNDIIFKDAVGNLLVNMNQSDRVELYFGGSKKFETYSTGAGVTGNLYFTSGSKIHFDNGVSNDYYIEKSGTALTFNTGGTYTFNTGDATFTGDVIVSGSDTATLSETGLALSRSNSYIQSTSDNSDTLNIGQSSVRWGHVKVDGADFVVLNGGNERFKINSSGNATFAGNVTLGSSSKVSDEWMYIDSDANSSAGIQLLRGGASKWFIYNPGGGNNFKIYDNVGGGYMEIEPVGNVTFSSNILTNTDSSSDIGQTGERWANLWVDSINGGAVVSGSYLPLAGGTMTGNIILNDSVQIKFGTGGAESFIYSDGSDTYFQGNGGNLWFYQAADDKDIIFSCDDGSGGVATYFYLDGSGTRTIFEKLTRYNDNVYAAFGTDSDLRLYHDGSNSYIDQVVTGHLYIRNTADDKNIYLQSDDQSGGIATYIKIDGLQGYTQFDRSTRYMDNVYSQFGNSNDAYIVHNGTDWTFANGVNDGDINFSSDDGSGGITTYMFLDGGEVKTRFPKGANFEDNVKATFGNVITPDLDIYSDGNNGVISTNGASGSLYITQNVDDEDIYFQADDGSGGVTTYFFLDGSQTNIHTQVDFRIYDSKKLQLGNSADGEFYSDGSDLYMTNTTGDMYLINKADDKDIIFQSDDGSGGYTTYFQLDGGEGRTVFKQNAIWEDNKAIYMGNAADLRLYHNATDSHIDNYAGNLNIVNNTDDGDINLYSDDGSGGVTPYLTLDGSAENIKVYTNMNFQDNDWIQMGTSGDLNIYHDGSNSYISETGTGGLKIMGGAIYLRNPSDADMIQCQSGAQVELYYAGSKKFETTTLGATIHGNLNLNDNGHLRFGAGNDLDIWHDGSHSYIKDAGTGNLQILATNFQVNNSGNTANMITASDGGAVTLFENGTGRLATTSTGVTVTGDVGATTLTLSGKGTSAATVDGDGSTTMATKGWVESKLTGATLYQGTWDPDVSLNSGYGNPDLSAAALQVNGYYYICSADGIAEPNGTGTEPDTWHTGDWVIWNDDVGVSGEWQKIDNTTVLSGAGTGEYLARWTDTETLGDSVVLTSGSDILIPQYIKHVGDTNTYFGFSGNDIIQFNTNGSERMRILSSGEVGIGTSTPSQKLEVQGTILVNNEVQFTDGNMRIYRSSNDMRLRTGGSDKMTIESGGDVGIGTTSPAYKLDVNGGSIFMDTDWPFYLGSTNAFLEGNSTGTIIRSNATAGFKWTDGGTTHMTLDTNGNLGIGTATPSEKLQIYDTGNAALKVTGDGNATLILDSDSDNSGAAGSYLTFRDNGATKWVFYKETNNDLYVYNPGVGYPMHFLAGGDLKLLEDGNDLIVGTLSSGNTSTLTVNHEGGVPAIAAFKARTNRGHISIADNDTTGYITAEDSVLGFGFTSSQSASNLNILSSGNVGINTTSPDAKLEVVGGIIAGGKTTYTIVTASVTTTGTAVAGVSTGTNGQSSGFIFTCFGGDSGYQRIIYSCKNVSGTWDINKDIDEGANGFDVTYAADGSDNITFTFKSRSGVTQYYAPKVTVEAIGDQINQSYIN